MVAAGSEGMHPKTNGRRRTVGGMGRTVCAFRHWNGSRGRMNRYMPKLEWK
jgi:hypothetical protein